MNNISHSPFLQIMSTELADSLTSPAILVVASNAFKIIYVTDKISEIAI